MAERFLFRALAAAAFLILGLNGVRFGMLLNPPIYRDNPAWLISNGLFELECEIVRGLADLACAGVALALLYGLVCLLEFISSQIPEKTSVKKERANSSRKLREPQGIPESVAAPATAESIVEGPVTPPAPAAPHAPFPVHPAAPSPYSQQLKQKAISQLLGRSKK